MKLNCLGYVNSIKLDSMMMLHGYLENKDLPLSLVKA